MNEQTRETERRANSRTVPCEALGTITVWRSPDNSLAATICDIAKGGIGIVVDDAEGFEITFQVKVKYQDTRQMATVATISEADDGRWRVGLQWNFHFDG